MGVTSILNIAKNALFAQQSALQVTSNNIANVNTPGYARQETILTEQTPIQTEFGLVGNGVTVVSIMSHYDKYLESSLSKENTSFEEQKTYAQYFSRIESVLDENNTQLTSNLTAFFNAWQDLSVDPTSTTARLGVATSGANLTSGIRSMYSELKAMQNEVNEKIGQQVTDINDILNSIAQLNTEIIALDTTGIQNSSISNQRAQLVQQLSGMVDIQTFEDSEGGLTVMTCGGKALVEKGSVFGFSAEKSATDGLYRILWKGSPSASVDITDTIRGGTLKGLIDIRDNQLTGFMGEVNDLAESLITEVNSVHRTGYTANGATNINFFKDVTEECAMGFSLSEEVKADARNIAVTSSASDQSNNDIALALAGLGNASLVIGGQETTYVNYSASIASQIGNLSQNAKNLSEYHESLITMVRQQRDSISGVSIDEEMSNLIKYQYAYQAAARLINVAESLMDSLMEISR